MGTEDLPFEVDQLFGLKLYLHLLPLTVIQQANEIELVMWSMEAQSSFDPTKALAFFILKQTAQASIVMPLAISLPLSQILMYLFALALHCLQPSPLPTGPNMLL
ncbi:hypothetical protein Cni_G21512 [Canna indica]|uniref:Uncharacterized protein n=1 Tax=Canna indica TaxID=4628 RepID=A0AAQ3KQC2_9LILI|nr:hypothetical protein Cni_G21512 [Canna indica]